MEQNDLERVIEQSRQVGMNLQMFLDNVKVSARTAEDRQMLNVFANTMEIVEKMTKGEIVLLQTTSLSMTPKDAPSEDPKGENTENGELE